MANRNVIIVGAGPGGLTLANALRRKGISCKVYERNVRTLSAVGGGFALASGRDWLEQLGFGDALARITTPLRFMRILDIEGNQLGRLSLELPGSEERIGGHLAVGVTRSVLVNMLADKLEDDVLKLGWELKDIASNADGSVRAKFSVKQADGTFKAEEVSGSVIVGCDGIHSRVRQLMHGPRVLGDTRQSCWLLLKRDIKTSEFDYTDQENQCINLVATGKKSNIGFVGYTTTPGNYEFAHAFKVDVARGGERWESGAYKGEDFKRRAIEKMKAAPRELGEFADRANPDDFIQVSIMDALSSIGASWHIGRVGILGDAAHAPIPTAGQGCNSAVGDGACLAKYLAWALQQPDGRHEEAISAAFKLFHHERVDFCEKIITQGRLLTNKWSNMVLPQTADSVDSALEEWLQRLAIKALQGMFDYLPGVVANGAVQEFKEGCGKVDLDNEQVDLIELSRDL